MKKKTKTYNIYSTESTYQTECETPFEFIFHKVQHTTDKKEAIYLLILLFEMQKFCNDSDIISAIGEFADLAGNYECEKIKKIFPFVEAAYPKGIKSAAIRAIILIIDNYENHEIPCDIQKKALKIARDFLIDEAPNWQNMNQYDLEYYTSIKIHLIEILSKFKRKDFCPILKDFISNKEEMDILVKVANGVLSGKPYKGDDLEQWKDYL